MSDFQLERYTHAKKMEWDNFVGQGSNGVFMFKRDFMDYHRHRFTDHSLMVYENGSLVAILPANESNGVLWSHQGLTYGGWVPARRIGAGALSQLFRDTITYLGKNDFTAWNYKQKPYVFERQANKADGWVMWDSGFELWRRDLSFVIDLGQATSFARDKRYRLNKAARNGLRVNPNGSLEQLMELVHVNLAAKFGIKPVHSFEEAAMLQSLFPGNISTCTVLKDDMFLGGAWLFSDNHFIHTQYLHFNPEGKELCAAEFLVNYLVTQHAGKKRYLSFGTSTENDGRVLNTGLASFKEGFGASGVCHDFYRYNFG